MVAMLLLAPLAGCYVSRRSDPSALRTTYVAPDGFVLVGRDAGTASGTVSCRVRRAQVEVMRVRGDTIAFRSVAASEPWRGEPACALRGAGFIDLAASRGVQRERATWNPLAIGLAALPALLFALVKLGVVTP